MVAPLMSNRIFIFDEQRIDKMQESTLNILVKAGWHNNRQINIDDDITILNERGYSITDAFINFFQKYGHINFQCTINGDKRYIDFDVRKKIAFDYDSVIINDYPKITKTKSLIPIGNIDGSTYLVISENYTVYSLYDGSVMVIGKKIDEALDNLCNLGWREFEEYSIPDWW